MPSIANQDFQGRAVNLHRLYADDVEFLEHQIEHVIAFDTLIYDTSTDTYTRLVAFDCSSKPYKATFARTDGTLETIEVKQAEETKMMSFTALASGTFTLTIPDTTVQAGTITRVSYSLDNGETWTDTNITGTAQIVITTPTVAAGSSVLWKGYATSYYGATFSSTGNFEAGGSVMSLLYGDEFAERFDLPAHTTFYYLFSNCTTLKTAPALPATELTQNCYYGMFSGCTALEEAPVLPATTLADACYIAMFQGCTALETAPALPATTLTDSCYYSMFEGCTSLTESPELPAEDLVTNCYNSMFKGCSSLSAINAQFMTEPSAAYTDDWVDGVANAGTFTRNTKAAWYNIGVDGVPEHWTVTPEMKDYLRFIAAEDGTFTLTIPAAVASGGKLSSVSFSVDGGNTWDVTEVSGNAAITITTPTIKAGRAVMWKGEGTAYALSTSVYSNFSSTKDFEANGNVMSLLYGDDFKGERGLTTTQSFNSLFKGCTALATAPVLPATTLSGACYAYMFQGCTSLTTAPELPAATLSVSCYYNMFNSCTRLASIKCLATDISAANCTIDWLNGVAATGTFTKAAAMTDWTTGVNGIPTDWTVEDAS